jgi:hypothetical protein
LKLGHYGGLKRYAGLELNCVHVFLLLTLD